MLQPLFADRGDLFAGWDKKTDKKNQIPLNNTECGAVSLPT